MRDQCDGHGCKGFVLRRQIEGLRILVGGEITPTIGAVLIESHDRESSNLQFVGALESTRMRDQCDGHGCKGFVLRRQIEGLRILVGGEITPTIGAVLIDVSGEAAMGRGASGAGLAAELITVVQGCVNLTVIAGVIAAGGDVDCNFGELHSCLNGARVVVLVSIDPDGVAANVTGVVSDPGKSILSPIGSPGVLDAPGALGVIPANDLDDVIDGGNGEVTGVIVLVKYAAGVVAESLTGTVAAHIEGSSHGAVVHDGLLDSLIAGGKAITMDAGEDS